MKVAVPKLVIPPPHNNNPTTTNNLVNLKVDTKPPSLNAPNSNKENTSYRLISRSTQIRNKWMEYQGLKNWDGLLDPLDDNLRNEILRYGKFVESAYRSFDFDASSPGYATCLYPDNGSTLLDQTGLVQAGYTVTKTLNATCGVRLPAYWARSIPGWVANQSGYIGYVAVCHDRDEIARLGRRDVVVAYRGTVTCMEWLENLRATLMSLPGDMASCGSSMVQSGFLSLYTSKNVDEEGSSSLQESIRGEVRRILETYANEPLSITVTGHSLGAALATLTAYDVATGFENPPMVTVVSFGGPRVGNGSFRRELERSGTKVLRIVNTDDVITKVPGFLLEDSNNSNISGNEERAVKRRKNINWLQKRVRDTQHWAYAEIGRELRLSSRDCPHLSNGNVATCHDLKTYLHLVDSFVSSNCPLRATAKKVMNQSTGLL